MLRGIYQSLTNNAPAKVHLVNNATLEHTAMLDLFTGPLAARLSTLSHAGLAEPKLWAMPPACLSVGQLARLHLARAMHTANTGDIVIADEFATPLDRTSAYALAHTMSRWASRQGITLIAATAHEDMEQMLNPSLVINMNTNATHTTRCACTAITEPIHIETGTIKDYQTLAHLHYRGSKPATHTLVLKAIRSTKSFGQILAGVLVVSMPTLNASWRSRAWPGVFCAGNKSQNAKTLNTNLRNISRVVVEPRSRGLGIASTLVRAYLQSPQTIATESIAAMGSVCPFFERAGMQPYPLDHTPTDLRLIDALDHHNQSLTDLITQPIEIGSLLERELITWSKARRLIPAGKPNTQTIQRLAPIAACRLLAQPRAYAHVNQEHEQRGNATDGAQRDID